MNRLLLVLILATACDRRGCDRDSAASLHATNAREALKKKDWTRALAAADLAASYDPTGAELRDLVLRTRLTIIANAPETLRVDDANLLDYQAETMQARDRANAATYLTTRGYVALSRDAEKSAEFFKEAMKVDEKSSVARAGLALLLSQQKKTDEAQKLLEEAITLDPTNAFAQASLGRMFLEKGDVEKATPALEAAVKLREDAQIRQNLAVAYWKAKKTEESGKQIQRAVQLEPKNASARLEYANWLRETSKAEEAYEQYGIAGQLGAEPQATFARGLLLFNAQNFADAAKNFDAAALAKMMSALYEAGRAYEAAGDNNTAVARYEKFAQVMANEAPETERRNDAVARAQKIRGGGK